MKYLFICVFAVTSAYSYCYYVPCSPESASGSMQVNMNTVKANLSVIKSLTELKLELMKEVQVTNTNISKLEAYLQEKTNKEVLYMKLLSLVKKRNELLGNE